MRTSCKTCRAPVIARVWVPGTENGPHWQFVELYECSAVALWGYDAHQVMDCPHGPATLHEDEAHLLVPILTDQAVRDRLVEAEQEVARLRAALHDRTEQAVLGYLDERARSLVAPHALVEELAADLGLSVEEVEEAVGRLHPAGLVARDGRRVRQADPPASPTPTKRVTYRGRIRRVKR